MSTIIDKYNKFPVYNIKQVNLLISGHRNVTFIIDKRLKWNKDNELHNIRIKNCTEVLYLADDCGIIFILTFHTRLIWQILKISLFILVVQGSLIISHCSRITFNKNFINNSRFNKSYRCGIKQLLDFDNIVYEENVQNSPENGFVLFRSFLTELVTEEIKDDSYSNTTIRTILLTVILVLTIIISLLSIFPDKGEGIEQRQEVIQLSQEVSQAKLNQKSF